MEKKMNHYTFTAMQGIQARQAYFVILVPLKMVPVIFNCGEGKGITDNAQRELNKGRVPKIANYLVQNPETYILPSLTASVSGEVRFKPAQGQNNIGHLEVSLDADLYLNDGQHRRAAIEKAIQDRPMLGDENISITLYTNRGLSHSQQIFTDLNMHQAKPGKSIQLMFDHRNELSKITKEIASCVDLFKDRIEFERSNIPNKSDALFTFSALFSANKTLLSSFDSNLDYDSRIAALNNYWSLVSNIIYEWYLLKSGGIDSLTLRNDYIHSHGVVLQALAVVGSIVMKQDDWQTKIEKLGMINWTRSNKDWNNRAITLGKVCKSKTNVDLTAAYILQRLDIELPKALLDIEEKFNQH